MRSEYEANVAMAKRAAFNLAPQVGMSMVVRGLACRIVAVLPAGTVDVVSLDGAKAFRVSGLSF